LILVDDSLARSLIEVLSRFSHKLRGIFHDAAL
jgi:hypothetical protein